MHDEEPKSTREDEEKSALFPPLSAEGELDSSRPRGDERPRRLGAVSVDSRELSALHSARRAGNPEDRPPPTPPRKIAPIFRKTDDDREAVLTYFTRRLNILDFLFALILGIIGCAAVIATYDDFGHSWDEALYLLPGQKAAEWTRRAFTDGAEMFTHEAIGQYWGGEITSPDDKLHPEIAPLAKLIVGAGAAMGAALGVDPVDAIRLPVAFVFGLTLVLLYFLGAREYGRTGGFAAALFYALLPRVFGHAHIAASETLLGFTSVLLVWTFLRGTERGFFALLTGIALGLALATKITALLFPLPLILWAQIYRRREYGSNVFWMTFLGPMVLIALWPWLWTNGAVRFLQYLGYYISHQSTAVYYLGQKWGYGRPAAPWHYPTVITLVSLPEWMLLFCTLGILRALMRAPSRVASVLFLLVAMTVIAVASLPAAPKYDGERLFFPAFPFLALLAAGGFTGLFSWGVRRFDARLLHVHKSWSAGILLVVIGLLGCVDIFYVHPAELNYFNRLVGGPRGARDHGFETSYWGEAVNEKVLSHLRTVARPGDRMRVLALNELVFQNLQQWGELPRELDFMPPEPPDWYILQVRYGMFGSRERRLHMGAKPDWEYAIRGVPMIQIFKGERVRETTATAITSTAAVFERETASPASRSSETTPTAATDTTSPLARDETTTSVDKNSPAPTSFSATLSSLDKQVSATAPAALDSLSTIIVQFPPRRTGRMR